MHIPNTISAFVLAFDLYLFPTTKTDSAKANVNVIISLLFSHIAVRIANAIADCPLGTNPSFISSPLCFFFEQLAFIATTAITTNMTATKVKCTGDLTMLCSTLWLSSYKFSALKNIKYPTTIAFIADSTTDKTVEIIL